MAIISAGERLFAERGPDVPLRDIARAAGNNNKSGVQYHFRDREGLISAIVELRLHAVEKYGRTVIGEIDDLSVEGLVEFLVNCLRYAARSQGSDYYMRYLETMRIFIKDWPTTDTDSWALATARLVDLAPGATEEERRRRVSAMATTMFALLADHERNPESAENANIVRMVAALFLAKGTSRAVRPAGGAQIPVN